MRKTLTMTWVYGWTYIFIFLGLLDRLGEWMVKQIDTNNYLIGALFMWLVFSVAWMAGLVHFGG